MKKLYLSNNRYPIFTLIFMDLFIIIGSSLKENVFYMFSIAFGIFVIILYLKEILDKLIDIKIKI